jgi:hypothetical protein
MATAAMLCILLSGGTCAWLPVQEPDAGLVCDAKQPQQLRAGCAGSDDALKQAKALYPHHGKAVEVAGQ